MELIEFEVDKTLGIDVEREDRHCDTCICDLIDFGWNKAEDNDSHCPTCFCEKCSGKGYTKEERKIIEFEIDNLKKQNNKGDKK